MDLAPDFDEFIGCLTAHGVEFIVVGAYALAYHGAPRFTGDLDVLIRPTLENAERFLGAVHAFGFPTSDLTPARVADRRAVLEMGVPPVQIHVMSTNQRRGMGRGVGGPRSSTARRSHRSASGAQDVHSEQARSRPSEGSRGHTMRWHPARWIRRTQSSASTARIDVISTSVH